jgi:hypothetical protein
MKKTGADASLSRYLWEIPHLTIGLKGTPHSGDSFERYGSRAAAVKFMWVSGSAANRSKQTRDRLDTLLIHFFFTVACQSHFESFEKETDERNLYSRAYNHDPSKAAKSSTDLETDSCFPSAYRDEQEGVMHTRNNWWQYDFKERRIVPTHYTIRQDWDDPSGFHLKSRPVETSADEAPMVCPLPVLPGRPQASAFSQ